jgi:hypothetical protein
MSHRTDHTAWAAEAGSPLPWRCLAAENFSIGYNVLYTRILRDSKHLCESSGINAVLGIIGNVHCGDNAILIRIVIGFPLLVSLITDRYIARFIAARRDFIDLIPQSEKAFCRSPIHDPPRSVKTPDRRRALD